MTPPQVERIVSLCTKTEGHVEGVAVGLELDDL